MNNNELKIPLNEIEEGLYLHILGRKRNSVYFSQTAVENGEASFQIKEGHSYHYNFSSDDYYFNSDEIIEPSPFSKNEGKISPNIFVGTLSLDVYCARRNSLVGNINLEVQSVKATYREDYRFMLEAITEKCTDLLMQANSPVSQNFETNFNEDSKTLYQRFAFISSIINSDEFNESVHRVVTSPNTKWAEKKEDIDIRKIGRLRNNHLRQISGGPNRIKLSNNHVLRKSSLNSLPSKLHSELKTETVDTVENRFIKHALKTFLKFCSDIQLSVSPKDRIYIEVDSLISLLETHLHHSFFSEVSNVSTLKLNSPILQRKEGYREILKAWLMFDLAGKITWNGGDDVYAAGKRDVATLYEYWLFFTLLDLVEGIFEIKPKDLHELIKPTKNGLGLQLKQGKHTAIRGTFRGGYRPLNIKFNFNRTFGGDKKFPHEGSWTKKLRPDYTLSIWPAGLTESEAELEELIVHVHFDAKYKIENMLEVFNSDESLDEEKESEAKGKYKNADLLKMHAYKDAIRRTGGAYILYPGKDSFQKRGFREILPGLGAFPVRPSRNQNGIGDLKKFIEEVLEHFQNRASQRENLSYRIFDIHKDKPDELKEPIPEAYGLNRSFLPGETNILVAWYHSTDHLNWINKKGLYNFRMESESGSLIMDPETVKSKFILLHTSGDKNTEILLKINGNGPKVYTKEKLIELGYPKIPSKKNYLVFEVEKCNHKEFQNSEWEFRKLDNYKKGNNSARPFTTNLTELMKVKLK